MTIDRPTLELELANVRQQQQHFIRLVEQVTGAEKAILGLLGLIDKAEAQFAEAQDAAVEFVFDDDPDLPEPEGDFPTPTTMAADSTERLVPR